MWIFGSIWDKKEEKIDGSDMDVERLYEFIGKTTQAIANVETNMQNGFKQQDKSLQEHKDSQELWQRTVEDTQRLHIDAQNGRLDRQTERITKQTESIGELTIHVGKINSNVVRTEARVSVWVKIFIIVLTVIASGVGATLFKKEVQPKDVKQAVMELRKDIVNMNKEK